MGVRERVLFGPRIGEAARLAPDSKELPGLWDAFQLVMAAVIEVDTRPGDEVYHCPRYQYLAGSGGRAYARSDIDRNAGDVSFTVLDLPRVKSCPNIDAEPPGRVKHRACAADRPRRTIEDGEEPIAGGFDLLAAEPLQLSADHHVMIIESLTPDAVTQCRGLSRRINDVRKEHGRQNRIWYGTYSRTSDEVLDLADQGIDVAKKDETLVTHGLDITGTSNVVCHVSDSRRLNRTIGKDPKRRGRASNRWTGRRRAVEHQSRNANRR